jgi:hypothetical protein
MIKKEAIGEDSEEMRCEKLLFGSACTSHALVSDVGDIEILMFQTPSQKVLYEY